MVRLQKQLAAICCAIFLCLPSFSAAQNSAFADRYATITGLCTDGNGGADQRARCLPSLQSLLADVRQQTDGAGYDLEIAALALSLINAYADLASPSAQIRALMVSALGEIAQSAADPAQQEQITAIATLIGSNSQLGAGIERLLASPN